MRTLVVLLFAVALVAAACEAESASDLDAVDHADGGGLDVESGDSEAPVDLCEGVVCDDTEPCNPETGACEAPPNPCEGVVCAEGENCSQETGECEALPDLCEGVVCADDEICDPDTGQCEGPSEPVLFRARLKDFQTKARVEGGACYLLYGMYADPDTTEAEALLGTRVADEDMPVGYAQPLVAGSGGALEVILPSGTEWGFECDLGESYKTTYQYGISSDNGDYDGQDLWIVSNGMYTLAPTVAGIDLDEGLGVVAGRLVWPGAHGEEEVVGCGSLDLEVAGGTSDYDIAYFGDNELPVSDDPDSGGRVSTNPVNGLFLGANVPLGAVTMTMRVGEVIVGQERIFSAGGAIVIANVTVGEALGVATEESFEANPTPDSCL